MEDEMLEMQYEDRVSGYDYETGDTCEVLPYDDDDDDDGDDGDALKSAGWGTDEDYGYDPEMDTDY
jgi:hypothetical protein